MNPHRKERLGSLIREELAKIVLKEIEFENALVTITEVEISNDLEFADVNFSAIPFEKSKEVLKSLNEKRGYLQHLLIKKLKMRRVPELKFKIDEGLEKAAKVEKIIIEEENKHK